MAMVISVLVNGVETVLGDLGALVSHTGWGMPVVESHSIRSPGQHGDTWGGFTFAPRIGSLTFRMRTGELEDMYTLRAQLLELFNPLAQIQLRFTSPTRTRQFDCHYYDSLTLNWDVADWAAQPFTVLLKASDPTCYDPSGAAWVFSLGGGSDRFEVPYVVPYKMGASVINSSQNITYPGSWLAYPLVRISGPIEDPIVTNLGTDQVLNFNGTHIDPGDYLEVDCRYGFKTVVNAAGVNKLNTLTSVSDLSDFHIAPDPEVTGGINPIHLYGTGITEATRMDLSYYIRDLGV